MRWTKRLLDQTEKERESKTEKEQEKEEEKHSLITFIFSCRSITESIGIQLFRPVLQRCLQASQLTPRYKKIVYTYVCKILCRNFHGYRTVFTQLSRGFDTIITVFTRFPRNYYWWNIPPHVFELCKTDVFVNLGCVLHTTQMKFTQSICVSYTYPTGHMYHRVTLGSFIPNSTRIRNIWSF